MNRISLLAISLILGTISIMLSCISPFEYESDGTEESIVVEGLLTDREEFNYVNIFRTRGFNDLENEPITNALVSVESSDGNIYLYSNDEQGHYLPPLGFVGIPGETYQLHVELDGEIYYTEPNLLIPSNATEITGRVVNIPDPDVGRNVDGVQFFVESASEPSGNHYRFEWEDTYMIIIPFPMQYLWVDSVLVEVEEDVGICYKTTRSDQIITKSIQQQTEKSLREFPIRFLREGLQAFRTRYSLLVRQFTLTSEAYGYFDKLKKNNEGGGSLFDKQTGPLIGNIKNDNQHIALGFFQVSGVTENRKFIRLSEFADQISVPRFQPACPESTIVTTLDSVAILQETGWKVYAIEETGPFSFNYAMNLGACVDCRRLGDIKKPEWWED